MEKILYPPDAQLDELRHTSIISSQTTSSSDHCLRFVINNCFLNAMFTLSQLVGYTQFMVFVIVRLIIMGSLAGRLFVNDVRDINCTLSNDYDVTNDSSPTMSDVTTTDMATAGSSIHMRFKELQEECLTQSYHGSISPLYAWALTLLSAVLPWLLTLPWTPFNSGQEYVTCPIFNCHWPCLTLFIACFMRAIVRMILELICFVGIIVAYEMYIPAEVTCHDGMMTCAVLAYEEKTYFLWIITILNLASVCLSLWEIIHMCTHKDDYDADPGEYVFREMDTSRTSRISSTLDDTFSRDHNRHHCHSNSNLMERNNNGGSSTFLVNGRISDACNHGNEKASSVCDVEMPVIVHDVQDDVFYEDE